ncbi:MAG: hypothetical protein R3240_01905 [Gammaproteobacteria bacterium]|nr:hypothetical protein [Gammaproteobacteria bacterium]
MYKTHLITRSTLFVTVIFFGGLLTPAMTTAAEQTKANTTPELSMLHTDDMHFNFYVASEFNTNEQLGKTLALLTTTGLSSSTLSSARDKYYSLQIGNNMQAKLNKQTAFRLKASFDQAIAVENTDQRQLDMQLSGAIENTHGKYADAIAFDIYHSDNTLTEFRFYADLAYKLIHNFSRNAYFTNELNFAGIQYEKAEQQGANRIMYRSVLSWGSNTEKNRGQASLSVKAGKFIPTEIYNNDTRYLAGVGLNISKEFTASWPSKFSFISGYTYTHYSQAVQGQQRNDSLINLGMEISTQPTRMWNISFQSQYVRTISSVATYEFSSTMFLVGVKRFLEP